MNITLNTVNGYLNFVLKFAWLHPGLANGLSVNLIGVPFN